MPTPHSTLFRRDASKDAVGSRSTFDLAPELAAKARVRIKWIAFLMLVLSAIPGSLGSIAMYAQGVSDAQVFKRDLFIIAVHTLVAGTIWWVARTPRFTDRLVLTLGLVLEVVICLGTAFMMHMASYEQFGIIASMTWVSLFIVLFPIVIPYPPRRMLWVSFISACTEPVVVLGMYWALPIERNWTHFGAMLMSPLGAILLAYFASRVIYGLNVAVTRARRLGSYQLEERLGAGGMGEVWRASHQLLARPAAVKVIHPESLSEETGGASDALARFEQEAQATASLRSAHTIQLYDFGRSDDGAFYYVMELLEGLELAELVDVHGPQEPARVVNLLVQACHSLEEAHRAGLIHRDIKPANLFVCRYGTEDDFVKVLDFGLVKEVRAEGASAAAVPQLTQAGVVVGSPGFLPPEVALGKNDVDGRADLYSLGCVAYWLLTGTLVFEGDTPMAQMVQHATEPPPRPSTRTELLIPEALEEIIMACLEKSPADRPASAQELAQRLEACPVESPWTPERARQWWDVHQPVQ